MTQWSTRDWIPLVVEGSGKSEVAQGKCLGEDKRKGESLKGP